MLGEAETLESRNVMLFAIKCLGDSKALGSKITAYHPIEVGVAGKCRDVTSQDSSKRTIEREHELANFSEKCKECRKSFAEHGFQQSSLLTRSWR